MDLKQVWFGGCHVEKMDNNLQTEENQNRESPLALDDVMEWSETNGGYEVVHGLPVHCSEPVSAFLSPKLLPEQLVSDSEKQPANNITKRGSGSISLEDPNCMERAHLGNIERDSLVNGHPKMPPCDVSTLHEPISTSSIQIQEHENNQHVNGTVHAKHTRHIREMQRRNHVITCPSHLDVPFTRDTGRNYPCKHVWPGSVIPINRVTESELQDPRLASSKSQARGDGRSVLIPLDVERSLRENVSCRQEFGIVNKSQFTPANRSAAFLGTFCHKSYVDIARDKFVEGATKEVVHPKPEPQEISIPEQRPEIESEPSPAQIEEWLAAANKRVWDDSFVRSPQAPLESPVNLSSSSPVSSVGRQLPVQVSRPDGEEQPSPQQESGEAHAAEKHQPNCQNCEPTPAGPEPPQAVYPGYHSQHLHWPTSPFWFPMQPLWSQAPLEQRTQSAAAPQMPSFSVAMGQPSAREALLNWPSERTLAQSLTQQPPSILACPSAFQPTAQAQVGSVPQYQECFSAPPAFLPPRYEQVGLSMSVAQQQPKQHESSFLPTQVQPSSGMSQLSLNDESASFAPPAAQSLAVPQGLPTYIAYPQTQPGLNMPMESQVVESSYLYTEIPQKSRSWFDPQATVQETPFDSEQMQLQSYSQLEPSLASQGVHSSKYSQVEAHIEREHVEQLLSWPEYSFKQCSDNVQNQVLPQGADYSYPSAEREGEHLYSNLYLQQNTESVFAELDPAEGSGMQPSLETQHTSVLLKETPLECSKVPQNADSAFHLQMAPQEHSSLSVQAQLEEEFQSFPFQQTLDNEGSYLYSQCAELSATPYIEEQLFRCADMHLNAQSVASTTAQSSEAHLFVHPHVHQDKESTPAVCMAPSREPHFLQPTMQMQGQVRSSLPLPYTAAATGTLVQQPESSISSSQPYTVLQQEHCWPTQVNCPVPMRQQAAQCMQSPQLTPLCSGMLTAPQSSLWLLPATNCQS